MIRACTPPTLAITVACKYTCFENPLHHNTRQTDPMTQGYPCGWAGVSSSSCHIQRYGIFHYICHTLVLYIWKLDAQTLRSYNITCFLLNIPVYWQCLKPWYIRCYDDCLNHSKHREGDFAANVYFLQP